MIYGYKPSKEVLKMIDKSKLFKKYPKKLLEKMKENMKKEYIDFSRIQQSIVKFKSVMKDLTESQSLRRTELQLTVLEDIIMMYMTPYTRQLLLDRILKQQENN